MAVRVYYRDATIVVSSAGVWSHGRRYSLASVDFAWRCARAALGRRAAVAGSLLLVAVLARLTIGRVGWPTATGGTRVLLTASPLVVRTMIGVLATAALWHAVDDIRRYGRRLELWAWVSGSPVLLLSTDDAVRYGRVCRALTRAINDRDTTRTARRAATPGRPPPR